MQLWLGYEFGFNLRDRKPFVGNDDALFDVIGRDEISIGAGVDAVARIHLGADRFTELDIVGVQERNILATFDTSFA